MWKRIERKTEVKFHNSFPIDGIDITRHANSLGRTHAKRTFFRTEHPLHAKLYKNVEKNNSNMAYNDSWSTWEQKGRAEPRREKNMQRVKTTARTFAGKPDVTRRPPARRALINLQSRSIRPATIDTLTLLRDKWNPRCGTTTCLAILHFTCSGIR